MDSKFTSYICEAGDCWDSVCTKTYGRGTELMFQEILNLNRTYADVIVFEGGEVLSLPTHIQTPLTIVTVPFASSSTITIVPSPWTD